jgi:hypothetical protein
MDFNLHQHQHITLRKWAELLYLCRDGAVKRPIRSSFSMDWLHIADFSFSPLPIWRQRERRSIDFYLGVSQNVFTAVARILWAFP